MRAGGHFPIHEPGHFTPQQVIDHQPHLARLRERVADGGRFMERVRVVLLQHVAFRQCAAFGRHDVLLVVEHDHVVDQQPAAGAGHGERVRAGAEPHRLGGRLELEAWRLGFGSRGPRGRRERQLGGLLPIDQQRTGGARLGLVEDAGQAVTDVVWHFQRPGHATACVQRGRLQPGGTEGVRIVALDAGGNQFLGVGRRERGDHLARGNLHNLDRRKRLPAPRRCNLQRVLTGRQHE